MEARSKSVSFNSAPPVVITQSQQFDSPIVGTTVLDAMPTNLTGEGIADGRNITQISQPEKDVKAILTYELGKLNALKSLLEGVIDLPYGAETEIAAEMKTMIQEEMEGRLVELKYDAPNNLLTEVKQKIASVEALLTEAVPKTILTRSEEEVVLRKKAIGQLKEDIEKGISDLEKIPQDQKDKLSEQDRLIGEMLVMKQTLERYSDAVNHGPGPEMSDHDMVKHAKQIFGCTLKPFQFLRETPTASAEMPLITMGPNQRDPLIAKIFREFTVGQKKVEYDDRQKQLTAILTDEELKPRVMLGEQYAIKHLSHWNALSQELLSTPKEKRNPELLEKFFFQASGIFSGPPGKVPSDLTAGFSNININDKNGALEILNKALSGFASKRIDAAEENIKQLEAGKLPQEIIEKYRESLMNVFNEIVHLQNMRVSGYAEGGSFDQHGGTMKAIVGLRAVHAIAQRQFTVLF